MFYRKLPKTTGYEDEIVIVPDKYLTQSTDYPRFYKIALNDKKFKHEVIITPHYDENFINTDILKFRIFCDQYRIKIISFGSKNQFPFFSIFSDEVYITETEKQTWYNNQWSRNYTDLAKIQKLPKFLNVEKTQGVFRKLIPDDWVVERFSNRKVHILKSTYDIFETLVKDRKLVYDQVICESKVGSNFVRNVLRGQILLRMSGIDQELQTRMVEWTGPHHYMGCQILCSNMLNWRYVCCGGASNLFAVIPMKSVCLAEQMFNSSTINIMRSMSIKRYGKIGHHMPFLSHLKFDTQLLSEEISKKLPLMKKFADLLSYSKKPNFTIFGTS